MPTTCSTPSGPSETPIWWRHGRSRNAVWLNGIVNVAGFARVGTLCAAWGVKPSTYKCSVEALEA